MPVVGYFPVESQVTGMFPLQVLSTPGTQTAPHCPVVMEPLTQAPWLLHVCGVVPEHWVALGEQLPVQAPLTHAWFVHACAVPHVPVESQVCTPLFVEEHFTPPGEHTPVQAPFAQA